MQDEWARAELDARAALVGHGDTAALGRARFTPIAGGLSNFAWRVTHFETDRFVRLARAGTERLGADLTAEAQVLTGVAAAGLAPPVVRCDPAARLLVTRWIEGTAGSSSNLGERDRVIDQVATSMRRLHALEAPAGLRVVSFPEQARRLVTASTFLEQDPDLLANAADVFAGLEARRPRLVVCHHDVHAENMILDATGRLWLVDWEYAGLGDPALDLASFASQYQLAESGSRRLVDGYLQAGGSIDPARLELARWAFDYVQWLWYRSVMAVETEESRRAEAQRRAAGLAIDLQARASGVLRCNNH